MATDNTNVMATKLPNKPIKSNAVGGKFVKSLATALLALGMLNACSSDAAATDTATDTPPTTAETATETAQPTTSPTPPTNDSTNQTAKPVPDQRNDERSMQVGSNGQLVVDNGSNGDINAEDLDALVDGLTKGKLSDSITDANAETERDFDTSAEVILF